MGCGCGKKTTTPAAKSIQYVAPRQRAVPTPTHRGIQVQKIQLKKCPKCQWPMNSIKRLSQDKSMVRGWFCPNRKCNHKEEI